MSLRSSSYGTRAVKVAKRVRQRAVEIWTDAKVVNDTAADAERKEWITAEEERRRNEQQQLRAAADSMSPPSPPPSAPTTIMIELVSADGERLGGQLSVPADTTTQQMTEIVHSLLTADDDIASRPFAFYINDDEITATLLSAVEAADLSAESVVRVTYMPQSVFRVRSVSRCTGTLTGHSEAVLHTAFSPDSSILASASGDTTVRLWDPLTSTPTHTLNGHRHWVLALSWSPNGRIIASGCMGGHVRIWNGQTGKSIGTPLLGHTKWITALCWQPLHLDADCKRLASASKDGTIRIWNTATRTCILTLSAHSAAVKCLRWGGTNLIYSGSQDRSVKVWDAATGKVIRSLDGHAHWVNSLSLNTDFAIRTGAFDHTNTQPQSDDERLVTAKKRYDTALLLSKGIEMLVSGSEDFTLILWTPQSAKQPVIRMTGHQQPVNMVAYSPDGHYIASASFDKSIKLWNGLTGQYVTSFRGHVAAVYSVCWSSDSRLFISASRDSTIKCWDVRKKLLSFDLPGHSDEVYACDWSCDGEKVASGGKDKVIKIWRQ